MIKLRAQEDALYLEYNSNRKLLDKKYGNVRWRI